MERKAMSESNHFHSQSGRSPPCIPSLNKTKPFHFRHIFHRKEIGFIDHLFYPCSCKCNKIRWSGHTGLKNLFEQKSKAVHEFPETDRWLSLHSTPVPYTTGTLKVPSAVIPYDGTCESHTWARHPPKGCWPTREKQYRGEEEHQHRSRPGRQVVPGRYS